MRIACSVRSEANFQDIQGVLARAGFECDQFQNEAPMMRALRRRAYDLILVDTNTEALDDRSAYSWLICRAGDSTPVVILSTECPASHVAAALEAGVDDFMSSMTDPAVLVARLNALLRRCNRADARRRLELRGFTLDRDTGVFLDRGEPVVLTSREFTLAWLLFSSPGNYLSRDAISATVWGVDSEIASRTIEQHIYKLRKKLNLCKERGVRIGTAYNKGYRLELRDVAQPVEPPLLQLVCA